MALMGEDFKDDQTATTADSMAFEEEVTLMKRRRQTTTQMTHTNQGNHRPSCFLEREMSQGGVQPDRTTARASASGTATKRRPNSGDDRPSSNVVVAAMWKPETRLGKDGRQTTHTSPSSMGA